MTKAATEALTGADLAAARRRAGLTQAALGARVGLTRHAVSHWERRPQVGLGAEAPRRLFRALVGLGVLPFSGAPPHRATSDARAGDRVCARGEDDAWAEARVEAERLRLARRLEAALARRRVPCEARTRKGTPCRALSEPGRRRCRFHGGRSTGPKTEEGRARLAEAVRRHQAVRRAEREAPMQGMESGRQTRRGGAT